MESMRLFSEIYPVELRSEKVSVKEPFLLQRHGISYNSLAQNNN